MCRVEALRQRGHIENATFHADYCTLAPWPEGTAWWMKCPTVGGLLSLLSYAVCHV